MQKFLVPKKGVKVPFPLSRKFLKESGQLVEMSSYWIRRIKDGDVLEGEIKKENPVMKKKKISKKMEDKK